MALSAKADALEDPELAVALGRLATGHGGEAAEPEGGKPTNSCAESQTLTDLIKVQPAGSMNCSTATVRGLPLSVHHVPAALYVAGFLQPARCA